MNQQTLSAFIWSVADLLRGDYKQSDYGKVILPFTVLRRLDCVLEATKPAVLAELNPKATQAMLVAVIEPVADRLPKRVNAAQHALAQAQQTSQDGLATQEAKDELAALLLFKRNLGTFVRDRKSVV